MENGKKVQQNRENSHVFNCNAPEDIAEVCIPYSQIVQILRGKNNGSQNNSFPVGGTNVNLSIN